MLRKVIAAEIGRRLGGRDNAVQGALIGAATPWLLRRAFTPVGVAAFGLIGAKLYFDHKKNRKRTTPAAA